MPQNPTVTWTASSSGDWGTAADWSGGAVPVALDSVILPGSGPSVTLSGSQSAYSLTVDANAYLDTTGTLTLGSTLILGGIILSQSVSGAISDSGTIIAPGGVTIESGGEWLSSYYETTIAGSVVNNSTEGLPLTPDAGIEAGGFLNITGSLTGSGATVVEGELEVGGAVSQNITLAADGSGATLLLDDPGAFSGTISGLTTGFAPGSGGGPIGYLLYHPVADQIDLAGVDAQTATPVYADGTLTVTEAGQAPLTFAVTGTSATALQDATLTIAPDGNSGADISWVVGLTDTWNGNGDWANGAGWSLGFEPGTYDAAVIANTGVATGTIAATENAVASSLTLAGTADTLVVAGRLNLLNNPDLIGGTLALEGGYLSLENGEALLDDGSITAADGEIGVYSNLVDSTGVPGYPSGLTFGPGLTFTQLAGQTGMVAIDAESSFTNKGVINATAAGSALVINLPGTGNYSSLQQMAFANSGLIHVGGGETLNGGGGSFATYSPENSFTFANSGTLLVDGGSSALLGGSGWYNTGTIIVGAGSSLTLYGDFASASLNGVSYNGGTLDLEGIPLDTGSITATGGLLIIDPAYPDPYYDFNLDNSLTAGQTFTNAALSIDSGATLELNGAPAFTSYPNGFGGFDNYETGAVTWGAVTFNGPGATLKLDNLNDLNGSINGLTFGDSIDFAGQTVTSAAFTNGLLTVSAVSGETATYGIQGTFWADELTLASDGAGGTLLTLHPDVTPPSVTSVSAATDDSATDVNAGHVVTITLTVREEVIVTGTPGLTLNDGATAVYQGGSGTDQLTFTTTIQAGQNAADLAITGLDTSGGSILDLGNNALLPIATTPLGIQADTTAPVLTSVSTLPSEGVFRIGQNVRIVLLFSKPVSVSGGVPSITLANGGTALFNSSETAGNGNPDALVFTYTVGSTDSSTSADSVSGYQANGASISDEAGNTASLASFAGAALPFGVDTAAPPSVAGNTFFLAETAAGGYQVFATSGTTAVALVPPGLSYTNASSLTLVGDTLYFTATYESSNPADPLNGQSLTWSSDGTPSGTLPQPSGTQEPVAALGTTTFSVVTNSYNDPFNPGGSISYSAALVATNAIGTQTTLATWESSNEFGSNFPISLSNFITAGDTLYFLTPDPQNSGIQDLWETNGTPGGTQQVSVPLPGGGTYGGYSSYSSLDDFVSAGSTLFFQLGGTLYSATNGVATLLGPTVDSYDMVAAGNDLYFLSGGALYVSDGTVAGTTEIGPAFSAATAIVAAGNQIFVLANGADGSAAVWAVNGGSATQVSPSDGSAANIFNLTAVNGKAFFTASSATSDTYTLWVSNGTPAGTAQVDPGAIINPQSLVAEGNTLYFSAYDPASGYQLWSTDGTAAGTREVTTTNTGAGYAQTPSSPLVAGSLAYYTQWDNAIDGFTLWETNGTASGTAPVLTSAGAPVETYALAAIGTEVYATVNAAAGTEIWKTNGAAAGTTLVATVSLGSYTYLGSSDARIISNGQAVFVGSDSTIYALSANSSTPVEITSDGTYVGLAGDYIYYLGGAGTSLYRSDGTAAGTTLVGNLSAAVSDPMIAGGSLFALQYDYSKNGYQLDKIAGNTTAAVTASNGGTIYADEAVSTGTDIFLANSGTLWVTSGSGTTAQQVAPTAGTLSGISDLTAVGSDAFFLSDTNSGYQLWVSDGTAAGTHAVEPASGSFTNPAIYSNISTDGTLAYFWATDQNNQYSLWTSNGTSSGTTEIAASSAFAGYPEAPADLNGTYLFAPYITGNQAGLYSSTGTPASTTLISPSVELAGASVQDITPGPTLAAGTSGLAIDGYISGATVFADANGNGQWDPGEAETTTDAQGNFTLIGGSGPLILIGGTDTATGLAFTGTLAAPSGSTVVTPLTTVVQAVLAANPTETTAQADQQVSTAFGITLGSGETLTSLDPIAGTLDNTPGAEAAFAAQADVLDSIDMIGSALTGIDPSLTPSDAASSVLSTLANAITSQPGQAIDLTNATQVGDIVQGAASSLPSAPGTALVSDITTVVTASNNAVQQSIAAAPNPQSALQVGSAVEQVAQGAASTALADTSQIATTVSDFTGTALTQAVDTAETTVTIPCFCPGTLIRTDRGEVPVETLRTGDTVVTLSGQLRKLCWIGQGKALVTRGQRSDATPIIVRKGALADNVPHADLRITKGHGLYIQGVLIPVEFLVNHRSILWDDRAQEVTVYHLELETHDVLLANGAAAESYRDDGNRWLFRNANTGWDQPPKPACAPVLTGGPIVDEIWRRLLDRSGSRPGIPLTDDPDLHVTVDGRRVDAASRSGTAHIFNLPGQAASVKIMSRAGSPCELGFARDPRNLGVAVKRIAVRQDSRFRVVRADDASLTIGFHGFEPDNGWRWTDGEATLDASLFAGFHGPMELVLQVVSTSRYPDSDVSRTRAAAA